MNLKKTSSAERRYSWRPFFAFTIGQNKYLFALYGIISFLAMILPCFIALSDRASSELSYMGQVNFAREMLTTVGVLGVFVSGAIALLAGMATLSYVNSKKAVSCYHSLPVRRESIFLSETISSVLYYIVSITVGFVVDYFLILGTVGRGAEFTGEYLMYAFCAVVIFMYIYSVMLVAAGLCGSAYMRLIIALLIVFLPYAIYALVWRCASIGIPTLMSSYYLNFESSLLRNSFSFIRLVYALRDVSTKGSLIGVLTFIPEAVVYYVAALLLHKFRRSEHAENTVIWKPVFAVVKYALIITASLFGMVFPSILFGTKDMSSIFLATVIGLVISFLLVNSIMYRSSRMMFKGLKPFAVVACAMFIFMFFVPLNSTGALGEPYSASNTASISIKVNGVNIDFTRSEDIVAIVPLWKEASDSKRVAYPEFSGMLYSHAGNEIAQKYEGYMYFDTNKKDGDEYQISYTSDIRSVEIIQKPKFGIPLAKTYEIDLNSEFWDVICKSDVYLEAYDYTSWIGDKGNVESVYLDFCGMDIRFYQDYYLLNGEKYRHAFKGDVITEEFLSKLCLKAEYRNNSPVIGTINLTCLTKDVNTKKFEYPIYADDLEVVADVVKIVNVLSYDAEGRYAVPFEIDKISKYYTAAAKKFESIVLVHTTTGHAKLITAQEFVELAPYTAGFGTTERYVSTSKYKRISDSEYLILVTYKNNYSDINKASEIRFRSGAISDSELSAIFENVSK